MAGNEFEAMIEGKPMPEKPDYTIYATSNDHSAQEPAQQDVAEDENTTDNDVQP